MKDTIKKITAMEILDSRGNPTIKVRVELEDGTMRAASVPSGASTGMNEAVELRDNDPSRYSGKGVLKAVEKVEKICGPQIIGMSARDQAGVDRCLMEIDGSANKAVLGANTILGISLAVARAGAGSAGLPLFTYLGGLDARRLPVPCMNILNGGQHADNNVDFQEFMAVPLGAPNFREGLRYVAETLHALKKILREKGLATNVGDEGGFAPDLDNDEQAMELIIRAIDQAGYCPGKDISIAIDSAATSFAISPGGPYSLNSMDGAPLAANDLARLAKKWVSTYPIVLWEDPLAEDDWEGFREFTRILGSDIEVVGDDIFVTNPELIQRGINEKTANSSLIKPNQIGTLTETMDAVRLCRENGWRYFISHRSGETEDPFIADFAVAMGGGHLKTGSACRGERICKYNRLLEIEAQLGRSGRYYW